jgi:hypothetical protein
MGAETQVYVPAPVVTGPRTDFLWRQHEGADQANEFAHTSAALNSGGGAMGEGTVPFSFAQVAIFSPNSPQLQSRPNALGSNEGQEQQADDGEEHQRTKAPPVGDAPAAMQAQMLQRQAEATAREAGPDLEAKLAGRAGGGAPLSADVRSFMEPRFGFDFSRVRIHNDNESVQMNRQLNAQAFTHGSNIYFGSGKSPTDRHLLAHELTHVVQQTGASKQKVNKTIGRPNDLLEPQAKAAADQVMTLPTPAPEVQQLEVDGEAEAAETAVQPKLLDTANTPPVQRQTAGVLTEAGAHKQLFRLHASHRPATPDIPRWGVQPKLTIGQPNDRYEQEADRVAQQVMSMAPPAAPHVQRQMKGEESEEIQPKLLAEITPLIVQRREDLEEEESIQTKCEACQQEEPIQRSLSGTVPAQPDLESRLMASKGGGSPLPVEVRSFMEPRFGLQFKQVRVHTDSNAATMSQTIHAKAFTHGSDIYFNSGYYSPDSDSGKALLAHELTHTLQQEGSVHHNRVATSMVQPKEGDEKAEDKSEGFTEDLAWSAVRRLAPTLEPVMRKGPSGILDQITTVISGSLDSVFNRMMAPVRTIAGIDNQLTSHFGVLLTSLQTAAGQIANNDCTPISNAAAKIQQVAESLITPIVEKLQPVVASIKGFLNDLWEKIGAPIWGWIKEYASEQWQAIQWMGEQAQKVAKWIWETMGYDKTWKWFKEKLGIGEGAEGQDGILQWVQRKVESLWEKLKAKLAPFEQELTTIGATVAAVAVALSPAGPVLAIGAAVAGAVQGLRWIAANWGKGNLIVQGRTYLEQQLIPPLLGAANSLGGAFAEIANSLSSTLGSLAAGLTRAVGALGGSLLRVAVSVVQWIADQANALARWAQQQLNNVKQWVDEALNKLQAFLKSMLHYLQELGKVVMDVWLLPKFLKSVWNAIPECIRDPIIDFVGPIILRQIEIFRALASDKKAWQQTKADVMNIINLVFTNHDLDGAIKATYYLILRVFQIPPELVTEVLQKAEGAWDTVSKDPLGFIKNAVRSVGRGFRLIYDNLREELKAGMIGWLTGSLGQSDITLPTDWSDPRQLFNLVLDVLGLSVDHIWQLIEERVENKDRVKQIRNWLGKFTRAAEWVNAAIDTSKTPAENAQGIIEQAKDFGGELIQGLAEWVVARISKELAKVAVEAAATAGLSEVLDIIVRIYTAINTAVQWARKILDMVNQGLNDITAIAVGDIATAGSRIREIMHLGMPVVIGFLADQVGLGGVGDAIRDVVTKLRANVDKGIIWIIDKIKAGIEAIGGAVKAGVEAIKEWWKERVNFTTNDGEAHSLYFSGQEGNAKLIIASTPEDYEGFLNKVQTKGQSAEFKTAHGQALKIAQEISQKQEERQFDDAGRQKKAEFIQKKLKALVKPTKVLASSLNNDETPSVISYGSLTAEGGATSMDASILSKNHSEGSTPSDSAAIWEKANRRSGKFVQGHLLNHNIGGPGRMYNLIPITRAANALHHSQVEKDIKDAIINQHEVVRYKVIVNYDGHPVRNTHKNLKKEYKDLKNKVDQQQRPTKKDTNRLDILNEKIDIMGYEEKYLATSLTAIWGTLEHDGSKWTNKDNKSPVSIPNDLQDLQEPDI